MKIIKDLKTDYENIQRFVNMDLLGLLLMSFSNVTGVNYEKTTE